MKKVLLISHDIPSMTVGATLPLYHMLRNLKDKYEFYLVCFDSGKYDVGDIDEYVKGYDTINIVEYTSFKDQLIYTTKNMLSFDNLKTRSFLNYYYNHNMSKLINKTIDEYNFDIIITDMPMAFYAKNINLPRIVYAFDAVSDYNYKMYKKSESFTSKIYWYLNYMKIHNYEKVYNKFNSCIVVNNKDKKLLEANISIPIDVIPNGVDISFFENKNDCYDNRIVFLGDMSTPPNNDAVKYFIDEIYPSVLEENDIKFYIVGRNPSKYIQSLDNNSNITVTGSVSDVREFLVPGTIFITPMISGTGIKNKILEAMSMNLAVISTSIGISGIDATNGEDFILADTSHDFKNAIVELIINRNLRDKIANNARIFVKNNYSWKNSTDKLSTIIDNLIK